MQSFVNATHGYVDAQHYAMANGICQDVTRVDRRAIGRTVETLGDVDTWFRDMVDALDHMVLYAAVHQARDPGDQIDVLLTFDLNLENKARPKWEEGIYFTTAYQPRYTRHTFYVKPWMTYVRYLRTRHQRGELEQRGLDDPKYMLSVLAKCWHNCHNKWSLLLEPFDERLEMVTSPTLVVEDDGYTSWGWMIPDRYNA